MLRDKALAVQLALISLLGAWFANGQQRRLVRLLPLVPVSMLVLALLVRGG